MRTARMSEPGGVPCGHYGQWTPPVLGFSFVIMGLFKTSTKREEQGTMSQRLQQSSRWTFRKAHESLFAPDNYGIFLIHALLENSKQYYHLLFHLVMTQFWRSTRRTVYCSTTLGKHRHSVGFLKSPNTAQNERVANTVSIYLVYQLMLPPEGNSSWHLSSNISRINASY